MGFVLLARGANDAHSPPAIYTILHWSKFLNSSFTDLSLLGKRLRPATAKPAVADPLVPEKQERNTKKHVRP